MIAWARAGLKGAIAAAALALAATAAPARAQAQEVPTATAAPIDAQAAYEVARLRSPDPRVREAAARALLELGAGALPIVRREFEAASTQANLLRAIAIELDPQAAPRKDEPWYETKLRDAVARMNRGDHLGAWKVLDAILTIEPDCPIRDRVQALRVRARELSVRAAILDARLVPKRVLVRPGEPIEVGIEAKNVSGRPLDLAFDASAGTIYGGVEVEVFAAAPTGERTRRREVRQVHGATAARLAPGESWRTHFEVPALEPAPREVFRRVTISGSIRPALLARGDERFNTAVPLFPVEIIVVDAAHHALAADPLAATRDALRDLRAATDVATARAAEERLFVAALMAATAAREATIDLLAPALEGERDPAGNAAVAALAAIVDRAPDRNALRAWLRRRGGL